MFYLSLGILILIIGASLYFKGRSFVFKYLFIGTIILVFGFFCYQSYQQYQIWSQNELSKHLLPPYISIGYFIFYTLMRFFGPYLISLAAAILFLFSAKILNKKYEERFFYSEEYYLGALAIFLAGHPGWLFYLIFLIVIYLLIHLYSSFIIRNSSQRVSLYHLWIATAIFVIILSKWLQDLSLWGLLKI